MNIKSIPAIIILALIIASCAGEDKWKLAAVIESEIKTALFPSDTFNIVDFGAIANDTSVLSTGAISAAITKCNSEGGGVVLIPDGLWLTGPVTLLSNVNLHLAPEAKLLFSTDYTQYLPPVLTRWEGMDCYNIHPLIYAFEASNIAITGKGTIDGQASEDIWWWMKGNTDAGWKEGMNSQVLSGRPLLMKYEQNQTPVEERVFGLEGALRPQLINFYRCNTVLIEDVTLKNSTVLGRSSCSD